MTSSQKAKPFVAKFTD